MAAATKTKEKLPTLGALDEAMQILDDALDQIEGQMSAAREIHEALVANGENPGPFDPSPFDEEAKATVEEALRQMGDLASEKMDSYVYYIQKLDTAATYRRERARAFQKLAQSTEARCESLKSRLVWFLQQRDVTKVETPNHIVARQYGSAKEPIIYLGDKNVTPVEKLPAEMVMTTTTIVVQSILPQATVESWEKSGATVSVTRVPNEGKVRESARRRSELEEAAKVSREAGKHEVAEAYDSQAFELPPVVLGPRPQHLRIR